MLRDLVPEARRSRTKLERAECSAVLIEQPQALQQLALGPCDIAGRGAEKRVDVTQLDSIGNGAAAAQRSRELELLARGRE